ncbi:amidohydrolase family protein [Pseudonocardia kunmingensis]|uniref:Imidazolonepropionase-like amidohydrolase n=1 Tax=Pseudonocardia kunmingensis TaxID=630975 RepID=A0A543E1P0_9PSEU|nr:amidohydrolase family protein [Pseudonocardia kunmingensis]TQM15505.1 imidazolonepropionase-like amidohydrolase [Pseudonocardia kunmingensis]
MTAGTRVPTVHLRGTVLPDGTSRDVWVRGDRISLEPLPGATTLHSGGYLVPALVDAHCHPGTVGIGAPLDDDQLVADGTAHVRAGTALLRVPGSASRLPGWFGQRPDLPRVVHAGLPVAVEGGFFPGWGRQVPAGGVAQAAAEEARASGWCKLIIDWMTDEGGYAPTMPAALVADATRAVHATGGRVAVHTQSEAGGRAAVAARVDAIEHGMHLPTDVLDDVAAAGTVLVPTASTFAELLPLMDSADVPAGLRAWFTSGFARHTGLVRDAHEAGVTVLAGTDLPPGSLTSEIRWLAAAGLSAHDALGAGSWAAREWLGYPGIVQDAPADLLVFRDDPRADLAALDHPEHVIVRGRVVR